LHAESSAQSQPGAERVRQLGTLVTGSFGSIVDRRAVSISERTLPVPAVSLINRWGTL